VARDRGPGRPGTGFDDHRSVCGLRRRRRHRPHPTAASDPHPRRSRVVAAQGPDASPGSAGRATGTAEGGGESFDGPTIELVRPGCAAAALRTAPCPLRVTITLISNFNN